MGSWVLDDVAMQLHECIMRSCSGAALSLQLCVTTASPPRANFTGSLTHIKDKTKHPDTTNSLQILRRPMTFTQILAHKNLQVPEIGFALGYSEKIKGSIRGILRIVFLILIM